MRRHHRFLRGLLVAGTVALAVPFATSCAATWRPLPDTSSLPPADPGGKGRVLLDERQVRFEMVDGEPIAIQSRRRVVRIEGPRSKWLADLAVPYDRTFTSVVDARVRARFPDGKEKTWDRSAARDWPLWGGSILYTDQRGLMIDIPDPAPGTVVEQVSETRHRAAQLFAYEVTFADEIPVDEARLVVQTPAGMTVDWIVEKGGARVEAPPETLAVDGATSHTWERRGLAGLTLPPRAPPFDEVAESVFVRLASWTGGDGKAVTAPRDDKEHARFSHDLVEPPAVRSPALEAEVNKALQGVPDEPRARARRLYAWVRDSVRYCAVEVGYGGWVPHEAPRVLAARAGDCKDKANLLRTMLAVAGIESHIVVVYAGDWPRRFRLPVLAANFNHAILAIDLPGGRVFVDPTSRTAAFGDLPHVDEDRLALLADAAGSGLVPLPASSPESDLRDDRYELTLQPDGHAEGSFESSLGGAFADDLRQRLLYEPRTRHDELVNEAIALWAPRVKAEGLAFENAAPPEEPVPVKVKGTVVVDLFRGLAADEPALLRTKSLVPGGPLSLVEEKRDVPVLLGHRFGDRSVVRLKLPATLRVGTLPADALHECRWASYERRVRAEEDGSVLVVERRVAMKERVLPPDGYETYRAWAASAFLADEAAIVLDRRTP